MLKPTYVMNRVTDIDIRFLKEHHIKGLILDLDNTLTTHNNGTPAQGVMEWLDTLKKHGIKLIIMSNNRQSRVAPFAQILNLDFVWDGAKPLPIGFRKAADRLGLEKRYLASVGDQLYTDILGATAYGIRTVYVNPIEPESGVLFKMKRLLERPFLPKNNEEGK